MSAEQQVFYHLASALAIGLMIGVERGWKARKAEEGQRVAGVRTYGLIGILGGVSALVAKHLGSLAFGLAFVGVAGVLSAAYLKTLRRDDDEVGITSLVAGLLTFVLGALAAQGDVALAAAAGVVVTLLLSYKETLHRWVYVLDADELQAAIRLLLISVVLLPILPDRGYGPWNALNPYQLWSMVVLIAAISFVGFFAIKIAGARRGIAFLGLFGGLASSTLVTLHFSRMAGREPALGSLSAMGILLACGTMFPRIVLIAGVLNRELLGIVLVPAAIMALVVYLPALFYWLQQTRRRHTPSSPLTNPLELKPALGFGLLLAVVIVFGKALKAWFGDVGVLALAAVSGVTDVDAITISLASMSHSDLMLHIAAAGMIIAASVNSVTKAGIAEVIGGHGIGLRAGLPLLASGGAGALIAGLLVATSQ